MKVNHPGKDVVLDHQKKPWAHHGPPRVPLFGEARGPQLILTKATPADASSTGQPLTANGLPAPTVLPSAWQLLKAEGCIRQLCEAGQPLTANGLCAMRDDADPDSLS
jgi:hypothetical protein